MTWNQSETESLSHHSQHQISVEQRKSLSDAAAGPITKGEISSFWQPVLKSIEPAFGAEGLGVIEEARVAVHDPLRHDGCCPLREIVTAKTERGDCHPRHDCRRRIEP